MLTYALAVLWLLVFVSSALPVYYFYNMASTCHTIDVLTETPASINQLCVDARQYGDDDTSLFILFLILADPYGAP